MGLFTKKKKKKETNKKSVIKIIMTVDDNLVQVDVKDFIKYFKLKNDAKRGN